MNNGQLTALIDILSPLSRAEKHSPPLIESLGTLSYQGTNTTVEECYDYSMTFYQEPYFTPSELIGNCMNPASWAIDENSINPHLLPFFNKGICFRIATLGPQYSEQIATIFETSKPDPAPLTIFSYYLEKQAQFATPREFALFIKNNEQLLTLTTSIGSRINNFGAVARDSKGVASLLTDIFSLDDPQTQLITLLRLQQKIESDLPSLLRAVFDRTGEEPSTIADIFEHSLEDIADLLLYHPFVRINGEVITSYEWFLLNGGMEMAFLMAVKAGITVAYMTVQEVYHLIATGLRYMINPTTYPHYYALLQVKYLLPPSGEKDYLFRMNPEFFPVMIDNPWIKWESAITIIDPINDIFTSSFQEFVKGFLDKNPHLTSVLDIVSYDISAREMYYSYYVPLLIRAVLSRDRPPLLDELINHMGHQGVMSPSVTSDHIMELMTRYSDQELASRFGLLRNGIPLHKYRNQYIWFITGAYASYADNADHQSESRALVNARSDEDIMEAYGITAEELPSFRALTTLRDKWGDDGLLTPRETFVTWIDENSRVAFSLKTDFNPTLENDLVINRDDQQDQEFDISVIDNLYQLLNVVPVPELIPNPAEPGQYMDNTSLFATKRLLFKRIKDNNVMVMSSRLNDIMGRVDPSTRSLIFQVLGMEYWLALLLRFWIGPGNPVTSTDRDYLAYFGLRSGLIQYFNEKFLSLRDTLIDALDRQKVSHPYYWDEYMMLMNNYTNNSALTNQYEYVARSGTFINFNSVPGYLMHINSGYCMSLLAGGSVQLYYSIIWNYRGESLLRELDIDPNRPYSSRQYSLLDQAIRDTMADLFTPEVKASLADYLIRDLNDHYRFVGTDSSDRDRELARVTHLIKENSNPSPSQELIRSYLALTDEIASLERAQRYRRASQRNAPEGIRFQADDIIREGDNRLATLTARRTSLLRNVESLSSATRDALTARLTAYNQALLDRDLLLATPQYEQLILLYYKLVTATLIRRQESLPAAYPHLPLSMHDELTQFIDTYRLNWTTQRNQMATPTIGSPVFFDFEHPLDRAGTYDQYGRVIRGQLPEVRLTRFYQGYRKLGFPEYRDFKAFEQSARQLNRTLSGPMERFIPEYTRVLVWLSLLHFIDSGYHLDVVSPNEIKHAVSHADSSDDAFSENRYTILF